jgi:ER lumen protein retaining receptor
MNTFRLLGDLSHVLAVFVLLAKIWKTKSAAGKFSVSHQRLSSLP